MELSIKTFKLFSEIYLLICVFNCNVLVSLILLFILKDKPHWFVREFVWNITTRLDLNLPIFINTGILTSKERNNLLLIVTLLRG